MPRLNLGLKPPTHLVTVYAITTFVFIVLQLPQCPQNFTQTDISFPTSSCITEVLHVVVGSHVNNRTPRCTNKKGCMMSRCRHQPSLTLHDRLQALMKYVRLYQAAFHLQRWNWMKCCLWVTNNFILSSHSRDNSNTKIEQRMWRI